MQNFISKKSMKLFAGKSFKNLALFLAILYLIVGSGIPANACVLSTSCHQMTLGHHCECCHKTLAHKASLDIKSCKACSKTALSTITPQSEASNHSLKKLSLIYKTPTAFIHQSNVKSYYEKIRGKPNINTINNELAALTTVILLN